MEQREEVMDVFQKVCLEKQAVLTVSKPETASSIPVSYTHLTLPTILLV